MKITICRRDDAEEPEITVVCRSLTPELEEVLASLTLADNTVTGKADGETHFVPLRDVLYFESVDGRTFFYTDGGVYESPARLSGLAEKLGSAPFARISKSVTANLRKLRSIRPEANSRLVATLVNGEKLVVSRQYVSEIKNKLGV